MFWLEAQIVESFYMYLYSFNLSRIRTNLNKIWLTSLMVTHLKTKFSLKHKNPSSIKINFIKMNSIDLSYNNNLEN